MDFEIGKAPNLSEGRGEGAQVKTRICKLFYALTINRCQHIKPVRSSGDSLLPIAYEARKTFFGGEHTDSNQRLIYTWA